MQPGLWAAAAAVVCIAGCAAPPVLDSSQYVLYNAADLKPPESPVLWTVAVMSTDIRSIDWKDREWSYSEGANGYGRKRLGGEVEVSIVRLDGKISTHKVRNGEVVSTYRGEIRLP